MSEPEFPITIEFLEDNTKWLLKNSHELEINLEWFDSEDPEENAIVLDFKSRPVILKIECLELKEFRLKL